MCSKTETVKQYIYIYLYLYKNQTSFKVVDMFQRREDGGWRKGQHMDDIEQGTSHGPCRLFRMEQICLHVTSEKSYFTNMKNGLCFTVVGLSVVGCYIIVNVASLLQDFGVRYYTGGGITMRRWLGVSLVTSETVEGRVVMGRWGFWPPWIW
ncbi:hypothetical protein HanRHA438_Chr05g0246541 [Helianthus annuus]|nr:hypothetical protein HanRHA438_Chr05g0246541 [Helianthus annuus]